MRTWMILTLAVAAGACSPGVPSATAGTVPTPPAPAAQPTPPAQPASPGTAAVQPEAAWHLELPRPPETVAPALTPDAYAASHPDLARYWQSGLAEMNRFSLSQSRYGEVHTGEAVLVFVTEDFMPTRGVKYDTGPREDAQPALKVNAYRRYYTGLYPYTMLTSSFAPFAGGPAWKIRGAFMEWCGESSAELVREGEGLTYRLDSYFQGEERKDERLPDAFVEDEIWAAVRLDPASLPTGHVRMVPSLTVQRLTHRPPVALEAEATLGDVASSPAGPEPARRYEVRYRAGRVLRVWFGATFPRPILAWEEEADDPFYTRDGAPIRLVTRAVRTHALMLDYWNHHHTWDTPYRTQLGLTE